MKLLVPGIEKLALVRVRAGVAVDRTWTEVETEEPTGGVRLILKTDPDSAAGSERMSAVGEAVRMTGWMKTLPE